MKKPVKKEEEQKNDAEFSCMIEKVDEGNLFEE